jgi:PAS domain S-box-containing protein
MLLLVAAALVPAVAVQAYYERGARTARERAAEADALRLVRLVSADLDSVLDGARQFLTAAAGLEAIRSRAPAACALVIDGLLRATPRYANIVATDEAGRVVCTNRPALLGADASGSAWYQLLREGGPAAVGNFAIGIASGKPSLHLALALDPARHGIGGALIAALDLDWLAARLAEVPLPAGGMVSVVDRNGVILARWPDPANYLGRVLPDPVLRQITAPEPRIVRGAQLDGVERMVAVAPLGIPPEGLAVTVGLDPRIMEAPLNAANRRGLLVILGGGVLAFGLALFASRRFIERPVQALVATMERWRAGDAAARALADPRLSRDSPHSEFGRIAAAFDAAVAAVAAREAALRDSESRLRQIAEAVEDGLYVSQPAARRFGYQSPGFRRLFRLGPQAIGFEAWLAAIHPADRDRVAAAVAAAGAEGYALDYRVLRPDGSERLLRDRCVPLEPGVTGPLRLAGVVSDLTEERAAAERQALLAREVDHRAKNLLAVVQSILRLTIAAQQEDYAAAVSGRVMALARAHGLLADADWSGVDLRALLEEEVAGRARRHDGESLPPDRLVLAGPALRLKPDAVQPLGLVLHELATNARHFGALSSATGRVGVAWCQDAAADEDGLLTLVWSETGGPPVARPPDRRGFGLRIIQATLEAQLGGGVRFEWRPDGMRCALTLGAEWLLPPLGETNDNDAAGSPAATPHAAEPTTPRALVETTIAAEPEAR